MKSQLKHSMPLLLLAMAACHDGDATPTLVSLWPNADGSSWTYDYSSRVWDSVGIPPTYPTPADVPPPPTLAELADFFPTHGAGGPAVNEEATYSIAFDGFITTESGATGQQMVTELDSSVPAARGDRPPEELLARLWTARPDLRERLLAEGLGPPRDRRGGTTFRPMLLSGYAWARTSDWIGGYGDLDRNPSWIYLTADLDPGAEFTHQLLPAVADDVFLHARILERQTIATPLGVFDNSVVCLYLVDYGVLSVTNEFGGVQGYVQSLSYGTVAYVAGIGPIFSYERVLTSTGNPLPPGAGDLTLHLTGRTGPGS
jgi:hypothetical protein